MPQQRSPLLLVSIVFALLIGGSVGYYVGMQKASRAETSDAQQTTGNPYAEVETNPLGDVKTNPYSDVKVNPFE